MSRYFVTDPPVPVYEFDPAAVISDTPPNVIWIKARMDVETRGKVTSELLQLGADQKTVEFKAGANELALLVHNVVRWEGPDLSGVPCTPEQLRRLDPTEPHIAKVLAELAERNKPKAAPGPKPAADAGSAIAGVNGSSPVSAVARGRRSASTTS